MKNNTNPAFPKPSRSNGIDRSKAEFFQEIDVSHDEFVLDDGRSAVTEVWFDKDTRTLCQTIFYSCMAIETWSNSDHLAYLTRNRILKSKRPVLAISQKDDASGNRMWSVTEAIKLSDD